MITHSKNKPIPSQDEYKILLKYKIKGFFISQLCRKFFNENTVNKIFILILLDSELMNNLLLTKTI